MNFEQNDSCDQKNVITQILQSLYNFISTLVAWGIGCANPDVPGVYVNVYHYLKFITDPAHDRSSG